MARKARERSAWGVYHVLMRGNYQDIFHDEADYEEMMRSLHLILGPTVEVPMGRVYAYCLCPNHLHLVLREERNTVGEIVKKITSMYVYYYNHRYQRLGPLFVERFKSNAIETQEGLLQAIGFVNQNPLRHGLEGSVLNYPWSGLHEVLGTKDEHDGEHALRKEDCLCCVDELLTMASRADYAEQMNRAIPVTWHEMRELPVAYRPPMSELEALALREAGCSTLDEIRRWPIHLRKRIVPLLSRASASNYQISELLGFSVFCAYMTQKAAKENAPT